MGYGFKEWTPFDHPQLGTGRNRRLGLPIRLAEPARPLARGGHIAKRPVRAPSHEDRSCWILIASPEVERLAAACTRFPSSSRTPGSCRPTFGSSAQVGVTKPVKATIEARRWWLARFGPAGGRDRSPGRPGQPVRVAFLLFRVPDPVAGQGRVGRPAGSAGRSRSRASTTRPGARRLDAGPG